MPNGVTSLDGLLALRASLQVSLMEVEKMIAQHEGNDFKPKKGLSREEREKNRARYYQKIFSRKQKAG